MNDETWVLCQCPPQSSGFFFLLSEGFFNWLPSYICIPLFALGIHVLFACLTSRDHTDFFFLQVLHISLVLRSNILSSRPERGSLSQLLLRSGLRVHLFFHQLLCSVQSGTESPPVFFLRAVFVSFPLCVFLCATFIRWVSLHIHWVT